MRNQWGFEVVTPATAIVSTAEIKKQLEIATAITDHDTYLDNLVLGATATIQDATGVQMGTETVTFTRRYFPLGGEPILIPRYPLQSITSISYTDTDDSPATVSSGDYDAQTYLTPAAVWSLTGAWPATHNYKRAVAIVAVLGYGAASAVPQNLKDAVSALAAFRFMNRGAEIADDLPPPIAAAIDQFKIGDDLLTYSR